MITIDVKLNMRGLEALLTQGERLADEHIAGNLAGEVEHRIQKRWSPSSPSRANRPPAVVTGFLSDRLGVGKLAELLYAVFDTSHYAAALEWGNYARGLAARPYMRPAAFWAIRNEKLIRRIVKGWLSEVLH